MFFALISFYSFNFLINNYIREKKSSLKNEFL